MREKVKTKYKVSLRLIIHNCYFAVFLNNKHYPRTGYEILERASRLNYFAMTFPLNVVYYISMKR